MRVLIAGSRGQVGHALLASTPAGVESVGCSHQQLDITDPASVRQAVRRTAPNLVINAAAYTAVDRAEREQDKAFRVNATAVATLVEVCADQDIGFVHLSTDFVFDGAQSRPYTPDDPTSPQSAYGRSKLGGETAALALARTLVIRTAWVYSNRGSNFATTMLRLLDERDELRVVADQIGTPTRAASLASAIWDLIGLDARGVLHVTDAGTASWYDFAVAIQEEAVGLGLLDREIPIIPIATADYPTPASRPAYSVLDKSATWALTGRPARHWRVELREMLSAEKKTRG